jgi:Rps23 Pro-64 3,4-dihydroxylase Tpa1-like proline 4-hydroxylase
MNQLNCVDLSSFHAEYSPFPHLSCTEVLKDNLETKLYFWFKHTDKWDLTEEEFYTQYEFVLTKAELPEDLKCLISDDTIETIKSTFKNAFKSNSLKTVSIVAHKLIDGHKIGVHNDYINGEETHRLVIQINPDWKIENGGFLMLFNSANSEDVSKIVKPLNNSAFGFEISNKSYHAVSTVRNFSRYSIIYTFKEDKT